MKPKIEKNTTSVETFETDFLKEIVGNERLRAAYLAYVLGFVVFAILILYIFFRPDYDNLFQNYLAIVVLLLSISAIVIYELSVRYLLGRLRLPSRLYTRSIGYINALIEIILASFLLAFLTSISHSPVTLISPVLVTYFLIIILSTLRLDFRVSFFTGLLAAIAYILIYARLFWNTSATVNLMPSNSPALFFGWGLMLIATGLAAGLVAEQIKLRIREYFRLNQDRNKIINIFGQQVSHSIVDVLLKQKPNLNSSKREVTVMFLDIRDFTAFAEKNTPEVVVDYLNKLFSITIEVVNEHHGIINQFLGDGFMATFGAPVSYGNNSQDAMDAALKIIDRIKFENKKGLNPKTRIGIGLHSGEAVTGNIGTSLRKQYSITGNVVILASRIEQLNKKYHSQLIISEEVYSQVKNMPDNFVSLGAVAVKGREESISLYRLSLE